MVGVDPPELAGDVLVLGLEFGQRLLEELGDVLVGLLEERVAVVFGKLLLDPQIARPRGWWRRFLGGGPARLLTVLDQGHARLATAIF